MSQGARTLYRSARDAHKRVGTRGVARLGVDRILRQVLGIDIVHIVVLEPGRMHVPTVDSSFELRFLTPAEVGYFAKDPAVGLSPQFAERAELGLDLCYATLQGDRLANYGWYAVESVEAEHCAGVALGLPSNISYMYKGFTHPDFRGQRLHGAAMGAALMEMADRGIDRFLSSVYWSNAASLRSCDVLGYRRLGPMIVGPRGPLRVPAEARRMGVAFGEDAIPALEERLVAQRRSAQA